MLFILFGNIQSELLGADNISSLLYSSCIHRSVIPPKPNGATPRTPPTGGILSPTPISQSEACKSSLDSMNSKTDKQIHPLSLHSTYLPVPPLLPLNCHPHLHQTQPTGPLANSIRFQTSALPTITHVQTAKFSSPHPFRMELDTPHRSLL